jgi:hypothetical protein
MEEKWKGNQPYRRAYVLTRKYETLEGTYSHNPVSLAKL